MGRVEVSVFGKWGYVCDDKFGIVDASVLCRELGFPLGASEVVANSFYLPNDRMIANNQATFIMDEIECGGNETSLRECDFNGWGVHDCSPEEVVGVVCKLPVMKCLPNYWLCENSAECIPIGFLCDGVGDCADAADEDLARCNAQVAYRLNSPDGIETEGRIEVRYMGIWGTVCDDDFGQTEAEVFCASLGYGGTTVIFFFFY